MKSISKIFAAAGAAVALSATLALAADTTPKTTADAAAYGCPGAAYSGQMGPGMMGAGYGRMGYGHMDQSQMGHGRYGMTRGVSATNADGYRMGPGAGRAAGDRTL